MNKGLSISQNSRRVSTVDRLLIKSGFRKANILKYTGNSLIFNFQLILHEFNGYEINKLLFLKYKILFLKKDKLYWVLLNIAWAIIAFTSIRMKFWAELSMFC